MPAARPRAAQLQKRPWRALACSSRSGAAHGLGRASSKWRADSGRVTATRVTTHAGADDVTRRDVSLECHVSSAIYRALPALLPHIPVNSKAEACAARAPFSRCAARCSHHIWGVCQACVCARAARGCQPRAARDALHAVGVGICCRAHGAACEGGRGGWRALSYHGSSARRGLLRGGAHHAGAAASSVAGANARRGGGAGVSRRGCGDEAAGAPAHALTAVGVHSSVLSWPVARRGAPGGGQD